MDPYDLKLCDEVLKQELKANEPSVIIARRPCALLKTVKRNPAFTVVNESCKGCKSCMKIGCPAISMKNKKATIDKTLCVGCGLCKTMCAFGAINEGGEA